MMIFKRNKKAQTANILNLIVAIVLIIAAALPVTLDVIDNVTISGTTKTVVDLVPLFLGIGALVLVARSVIGGGAT
jgi:hypothetical protein